MNYGDGHTINNIGEFDYLGHKFSNSAIGLSTKAIKRIKTRVSRIIYIHLLLTPRGRGVFSKDRLGSLFFDWDLVTCINEIRRYIYGGTTENQLWDFIKDNKRIGHLKGVMGFYPLVTSSKQFSSLDGWLVDVLHRALRERYSVLSRSFGIKQASPSKSELIDGSWYSLNTAQLNTRLPSFVLAWRASRKSYKQYGFGDLDNPSYYSSLEGVFDY